MTSTARGRESKLTIMCVTKLQSVAPRLLLAFAAPLFGCAGGGTPPAETPVDEPAAAWETPADASAETPSSSEPAPTESEIGSQPPAGAEPAFTENMSVAEAEKVVPQGMERANLDPETLAKPLQNVELYEPCKPGTAKVKLKVAVWNGKAVGVDVTTTPKNETLASCISGKIRELTWEKKVRSLNAVEYQF